MQVKGKAIFATGSSRTMAGSDNRIAGEHGLQSGITTHIWILSNWKAEHRRTKIQLIDATMWFKPLRKNLGRKNCELTDRRRMTVRICYVKHSVVQQWKCDIELLNDIRVVRIKSHSVVLKLLHLLANRLRARWVWSRGRHYRVIAKLDPVKVAWII